jgi:hypothetical protein
MKPRVSIGEAVNALAWEVGALPDDQFEEVWRALGSVVRAVTDHERSRFEARAAIAEVKHIITEPER